MKKPVSEETFKGDTNFNLNKIKDSLVLDVGCGMGRYLDVVSRYGAESIGIDLSFAVDAAFENIGLRDNVHIIQADVFNLPFKDETFDYIYSIGVLHHTPDTESAFKQLPRFLRKKGRIAIWVYDRKYPNHVFSDMYRKITTRIPKKLLYYLCYISIPMYYLKKIPAIGQALMLLFPTALHDTWDWTVLNTFDWYSPTYQNKHTYPEVFRWFVDSELEDINLMDHPIAVSGSK